VSDPADYVRTMLDSVRIDAHAALRTALAKVAGEFSMAGRSGSDHYFSACEREIRAVYEATLAQAVDLLARLPASALVNRSGVLAGFSADLAQSIQANRESLRSAASRYPFDHSGEAHVGRTAVLLDRLRRAALADFQLQQFKEDRVGNSGDVSSNVTINAPVNNLNVHVGHTITDQVRSDIISTIDDFLANPEVRRLPEHHRRDLTERLCKAREEAGKPKPDKSKIATALRYAGDKAIELSIAVAAAPLSQALLQLIGS
jgi:hypothetical protein